MSSYSSPGNIFAIVHPVPSNLAYGGVSVFRGIANVSSFRSDAEHAASGGNPAAIFFSRARVEDETIAPISQFLHAVNFFAFLVGSG